MEFFKPNLYVDFMKYRKTAVLLSLAANLLTFALFIFPGAVWGVDFRGGTELQLQFKKSVEAGKLRSTLSDLGYKDADVVAVAGRANEYIVRVGEISSLTDAEEKKIRDDFRAKVGDSSLVEWKMSPGREKVTFQLGADVDTTQLTTWLGESGAKVKDLHPFGRASDHKFEARVEGVADEIVGGLLSKLGADVAPAAPSRVEWVGPRAGAQLRDAAIKSMLYAMGFIMLFVALRFDIRFAPGGVIAMLHDAVFTVGILIILRMELTLGTVAALLTIIGYSINDTIVVFDRIRENLTKYRDKSLSELVNISTSQTLGRTIMTSIMTVVSLLAFFVVGTPLLRDFAITMVIGVFIGTYSSIYIASPIVEWMDVQLKKRNIA